MAKIDKDTIICPECGSQMWPDDDHTFEVRVFVCTKPTCLCRIYPDYPKRSGNQEICYLCGKMFTARENDLGVLCPSCKARVRQHKKRTSGAQKGIHRTHRSQNVLHI